jgi:integrase/recombinase XerC
VRSVANQEPGIAERRLVGFLAYLEQERRLSRHTVENYGRDVRLLLTLNGSAPFEELRVHHIRRFVARLHGKGLGGRSLARVLSAWRSFFHYLAREHGLQQNPCIGVRPPRAAKRLPAALSPEEAARLLELPAGTDLALRDLAIMELMYSSGLRLSELTSLRLGDVDFAEATVRVLGKGAKTRVVPVGRVAVETLLKWLEVRTRLAAPEVQAVFINRHGQPLGARTVQARVRAWAISQGLAVNVHPHMLRHSFASHVLQSSGDLRAVQEMLGHASISSTQVYTHLDWQHLAKVYDAAHPRAKRKASKE